MVDEKEKISNIVIYTNIGIKMEVYSAKTKTINFRCGIQKASAYSFGKSSKYYRL